MQLGLDDIKMYTQGELWVKCLKQEAFHRLRTQQQLGYIVALTSWSNITVASIAFILQSSTYLAETLESRCEQFLLDTAKTLDAMSDADFTKHVRLHYPKGLEQLFKPHAGHGDCRH